MTPQQKIAERIYDLLPHKKELAFGCKVKHKKRGIARYVGINKRVKNLWFDNEEEPIYAIDIGGNSEIIGQPIRLADILLAIKKHITVTEDKDWLPFDVLCRKVIIQNHYNLEKDNILDQSDEFCEFLLELLK